MLIKLRARIYLLSEEDMETQAQDENLGIEKEGKWVWRNVAYPVEYITCISAYNKERSIIYISVPDDYSDSLLVDEDFDSLFERWNTTLSCFKQDLEL